MKKIILFFIYALFSCIALLIGARFLLPLAEPWLKNVYIIKHFIAEKNMERRIIVIGGSSTLFGFDGTIVDRKTNFTFLNLGSHAGLPINYHIDKILQIAKKGDIIFFPLEFHYYVKTNPHTSWYIQNMLFWDQDYRKYITQTNTINALLTTPPTSLIKAFIRIGSG